MATKRDIHRIDTTRQPKRNGNQVGKKTEELVGVYAGERWRAKDSDFAIGTLDDRKTVKGDSKPGELIPGLTYRFLGRWTQHPTHGPSFQFSGFVQHVPHTREAVATYLAKFADGVGQVTAWRIVDTYGPDKAIAIVKTDPRRIAAEISRMSFERAKRASDALVRLQRFEQTKIDLLDLFAGKGFPGSLINRCIEVFGVKAAEHIRRDPFALLTRRLPGCGFLRVDTLYCELGLPTDRLKRQVICIWHFIRTNPTGSTWVAMSQVIDEMRQKLIGDVRPQKAVELGVRAGWLMLRQVDGKWWAADRRQAEAEDSVRKSMEELQR